MIPSPVRPSESAPAARVLVVDDEPAITELLSTALRYMGYEVTTAASGLAALDAAATAAPDLVVLDVMLPDIDGFEVCRRLRDSRDFVPVIFLTARDAEEDRVTGFIRGGDDYVTKPFSLEELTLRIGALLRRTRGRGRDATDAAAALPRPRDGRGPPPGLARRTSSVDSPRPSSACCATCCSTPSGCSRSSRSSTTSGSTTSTATRTSSRPTSATSAASSTRSDRRLIRTVRGFGYMLRADAPPA